MEEFDINNIDEYINKAAARAANDVFGHYQKEESKNLENKYISFTKELLENYNTLQNGSDDSKIAISETHELAKDDLSLESIISDKVKTKIMIDHIDRGIINLKFQMMEKDMIEKTRAVELIYFECVTYEVAARELICSKDTIRRWINEMIEELSILLWGIDGLMIDV